jgi:hypothetical protein
MAKINNLNSIKKKTMEHLRSKIRAILTINEFQKVDFKETEGELKWDAPKEIQEKILKGIKK